MSNEPLSCACCHPVEKGLIIGALLSGRVGVWSVADGTLYSVSDRKEPRHTNRIVGSTHCGRFIHRMEVMKTALVSTLASVSQDGVVCVWSPTSLTHPITSVYLKDLLPIDATPRPKAGESTEQERDLVPSALSGFDTRSSCLLVGCEDGRVLVLSVRNSVVEVESVAWVHATMVTSIDLEVLPRDVTLVASAGMDWCVNVWCEEVALSRGNEA